MTRLLLYVTLACTMILGIVLSWQPAQATSDTVVYTWGYDGLGQHEKVCQQITSHLHNRRPGLETQPVRMTTHIVAPEYCH